MMIVLVRMSSLVYPVAPVHLTWGMLNVRQSASVAKMSTITSCIVNRQRVDILHSIVNLRFYLLEQVGSFLLDINGPIYTRDGSSVWDELGQRTVVRLIIRLCINTGFQTDHPSRRTITVVRLDRRTTVDNSSGRMIRLSV